MLTSVDFLNIGQSFPPKEEIERLRLYQDNKYLFEGKHDKVFKDWLRLLREDNKATLELILNWNKRLTTLWADLLLGEPPRFICGEQNSKEQQIINDLISQNNFINTSYEVVIDLSRFGDGLYKVRRDEKNRVLIEGQPPAVWFPVCAPDNVKNIQAHVLAWTYKQAEASIFGAKKEQWYLKTEIHERGKITNRLYLTNNPESGGKIGTLLEETVIETGIDDFLVIQASNLLTTDSITGLDDYSDLDSIIQELEVRIAQISRILDKHSDPNMYGSPTVLQTNMTTGETTYQGGGKFFPVLGDDKPPGYVTWDGQLEAAFKEIDILMEQLYFLSETSPAVFGQLKSGLAESGSALKRLLMAPLAKVNRIRMRFDPAMKKCLSVAASLAGQGIEAQDISIVWKDGIPADVKEQAEVISMRTGNKATMSQKRAIQVYDELSEEEAMAELELIADEEAQSNPVFNPFPVNNQAEAENNAEI